MVFQALRDRINQNPTDVIAAGVLASFYIAHEAPELLRGLELPNLSGATAEVEPGRQLEDLVIVPASDRFPITSSPSELMATLEEHGDTLIESLPLEDFGIDRESLMALEPDHRLHITACALCIYHPDPDVQRFGVHTLDDYDIPAHPVQEALTEALASANDTIREEAASALMHIGEDLTQDSLVELVDALDDDNKRVTYDVAVAISRINPQILATRIPDLLRGIRSIGGSEHDSARAFMANALGRMGEDAKPLLPDLVKLGDDIDIDSGLDELHMGWVIKAAVRIDPTDSGVDRLIRRYLDRSDFEPTKEVCEAIAARGPGIDIDSKPLFDYLHREHDRIRYTYGRHARNVGKAIAALHPGRNLTRELSRRFLFSRSPQQKAQIAMALVQCGGRNLEVGAQLLIDIAESDGALYSKDIRVHAATTLAQVGKEGVGIIPLRTLEKIALGRTPSYSGLRDATESLQYYGPGAVDTLIRIARSEGSIYICNPCHYHPQTAVKSLAFIHGHSDSQDLDRGSIEKEILAGITRAAYWHMDDLGEALRTGSPALLEVPELAAVVESKSARNERSKNRNYVWIYRTPTEALTSFWGIWIDDRPLPV